MMEWLPRSADFRAELGAIAATAEPSERLHRLHRLANLQLDFIETIQIDRELERLAAELPNALPEIRLAILSTHTIDHLVPGIRVAGLRRRMMLRMHCGAYDQYRQELAGSSELVEFSPDFVVLSLAAPSFVPTPAIDTSPDEADAVVAGLVADLEALWAQARRRLGCTVIQQTFLDVAEPTFGNQDRLIAGTPGYLHARLNARVADAARLADVLLLDIDRIAARDGVRQWFDRGRWLQGRMEVAPAMAPCYGELLVRLVAAQRGMSKKCLVLDLDNTLWGGVIGDDGLAGIVLGEGSPAGEAYLALQRYALALKSRGVILAVCSKNDPDIATSVFERHPECLLQLADIAVFIANWDDKAANLRRIAEQLNIGLDSLVFVDDNAAERARVRAALPDVCVPELPDDPAQFVERIAAAGYFEAVSLTAEDAARADQYSANAEREALRGASESLDDFLCGLAMRVDYGEVSPTELNRVTQLLNKTNQFNTTGRRFSREEIQLLAESPDYVVVWFRLADRFGDNGLVSVMVLHGDEPARTELELINWVMSCRVFGRQLEEEAMNIAVDIARRRGIEVIRARYIRTDRNRVIENLFANLGFAKLAGAADEAAGESWRLDIAEYTHRPTNIAHAGEST